MASGRTRLSGGAGCRWPGGAPASRRAGLAGAALIALLMISPSAAIAQPNLADPVDPSISDGTAQRKLDDARRLWARSGVRSYRYLAKRTCFCLPPPRYHRVVVVRGRPSRRTARQVRGVASVPRLFGKIQRAIKARVAKLVVTYGNYGVPRRISIDPSRRLADDEVGYRVRRFRVIRRWEDGARDPLDP